MITPPGRDTADDLHVMYVAGRGRIIFDGVVYRQVQHIHARILVVYVLPGVQKCDRQQSHVARRELPPPGERGKLAYFALRDVHVVCLLRRQQKRLCAEQPGVFGCHVRANSIRIPQTEKAESLSQCGERGGQPCAVGKLERAGGAAQSHSHRVTAARRVAQFAEKVQFGAGVVGRLIVRLLWFEGVAAAGRADIEDVAGVLAERADGGKVAVGRVIAATLNRDVGAAFFCTGQRRDIEDGGGLPAELRRESAGHDLQAVNGRRHDNRTLPPGERIWQWYAVHDIGDVGMLATNVLLSVGVGGDPGLSLRQRLRIAAGLVDEGVDFAVVTLRAGSGFGGADLQAWHADLDIDVFDGWLRLGLQQKPQKKQNRIVWHQFT